MAVQKQPDLIEQWIEPHPWRRGVEEARLRDPKISVWALIGHLRMVDGDLDRVAEDYRIPREAVEAAVAYHARYRSEIDARLARVASSDGAIPSRS